MALGINTNTMSLNAQRQLSKTQDTLATTMQRLSSGLRINSAKDDAAGLAISERMTAQIRGMSQATRNANDAISLAQTAEGALSQIGNSLQRMRELSVQASNASNSDSDRAALQQEMTQLSSEIQRSAEQTAFNGIKLLDGSFTSQKFQIGADANQTIVVDSILNAKSTTLGSQLLTADGTITGNVVTGSATANGIDAATAGTAFTISTDAGTSGNITYAADSSAKDIADAINTATSKLGVTATATNSATLSGFSSAGTVSFQLNGTAINATLSSSSDLSNLAAAINGVADTTKITATYTNSGSKASLTLTTTDGRNIGIGSFALTPSAGTVAQASFGGTTIGDADTSAAGGEVTAAIKTGTIELSSTKGKITTANANAEVFTASGINNSSLTAVSEIDLTVESSRNTSIKVLDSALAQVNSARASLGAMQSRFESAISNLQTANENIAAARGRIMDADFAAETSNLSRAQVLQQAGTAMLQQANSMPSQVVQLLRG